MDVCPTRIELQCRERRNRLPGSACRSADMTRLSYHEKHQRAYLPTVLLKTRHAPRYLSGRRTGPQLAAFYLFTCGISRPASPRSSAPTQRCPRSKTSTQTRKKKKTVQDYSPKLNSWRAACASLQERTLIAVFRLQGLVLLHVGWSQPGTSCRTVQTCWDAWRGVLSSPFFFHNPNSLCLLSLPALS